MNFGLGACKCLVFIILPPASRPQFLNFRHTDMKVSIIGLIHFSLCLSCGCFCCWLPSRGHEAYLRTGPHYDFDHYRQLVHEITQAFCGISKEVLEIKEKLHHDFDRPDLSEHIEKLQSKEKQKLELVGVFMVSVWGAHDSHGRIKNIKYTSI